MRGFKRVAVLWLLLSMVYLCIEILWRGYTHRAMLVVGGLCGVLIGMVNQVLRFYKLPVFVQSLIGACIVLAVELVAGLILNVWLGLGIWDYSNMPLNRESLQRLDDAFEDIPERVRAVEESTKQAHHRINNLEGRMK